MSKPVELSIYDTKLETVIQTDASRSGIGATLSQIQIDGSVKLVCVTSRALSETEQRYATIEQEEALAIMWACEKFRQYILGKAITIKTDHKPLVPLLSNIEQINYLFEFRGLSEDY